MKKRIVFITDCTDIAYNELRATVISRLSDPDDFIIEPVVPVKPFSIINGKFVLRLMAEVYPENTIFSVILNPMQVRPARLIGKTSKKNFLFMGANTGVFDWFLKDFGISELFELKDPGFFPFGGKFIHAPAIAEIASGRPLKEMGTFFDCDNLTRLDIPIGTIVHIDNFGLMKIYGLNLNSQEGDTYEIRIGNMTIPAIFTKRMMSQSDGKWVIYPGSSLGLIEIGKVRENGAKELNVREGDIIEVLKSN